MRISVPERVNRYEADRDLETARQASGTLSGEAPRPTVVAFRLSDT